MLKKQFYFVAVLLIACLGCTGSSSVQIPKMNASDVGAAALKQYDANNDGKIVGKELTACPGVLSRLKYIDTDHDQAISSDEITARIQQWQKMKIGLTLLRCTVTFRGQPLQNARVTLEPEAFLGNTIAPGEGVTNQAGYTSIKQVENDLPGMPLGFYKIKITSDTTQVPATYNENTTLGVEIAPGSIGGTNNIQLNLQ